MGAGEFEEEGPDGQVSDDFPGCRALAFGAESQRDVQAKEQWQGAGDEQEIVEVMEDERKRKRALQDQLVQREKGEGAEENGIAEVTERFRHQTSARMMSPAPRARSSLAIKVTGRDDFEPVEG